MFRNTYIHIRTADIHIPVSIQRMSVIRMLVKTASVMLIEHLPAGSFLDLFFGLGYHCRHCYFPISNRTCKRRPVLADDYVRLRKPLEIKIDRLSACL